MDAIPSTGANLWTTIKSLTGVYRCDPCRRTPDLGKWNISCALEHHPTLCKWLDDNLIDLWNAIPGKDGLPKIVPFPVPERLSKGRRASSGSSVASGLTDASPVKDYFRKLELNLTLPKLQSSVFCNAWNKNLPVDGIAYTFDATDFPNLAPSDKTNKSTVTTASVQSLEATFPTQLNQVSPNLKTDTRQWMRSMRHEWRLSKNKCVISTSR
jgi:hypothetical protein